jgi:chromosome segregation ATPase
MELIADILLAAGALGAGFYCFVLGRRLNRFNDLEKGVGGAVAVLSAQVDDLTKTLAAAQAAASTSAKTLADLTERAEHTNRKLELQMAALHDIPDPAEAAETKEPEKKPVAQIPEQPAANEPMFIRRASGGEG